MTRPTQHPAPNSTARKAETERRANLTVVPCCDAAAKVGRVGELLAANSTREEMKAEIKRAAMDRFASDFLANDARAWLAGFAAAAALDYLRAALDGPTAGGAA